jgi:hypothetical protein
MKDTDMYKAMQNFAFVGKTYFVGDEVPAQVAMAVDPSFTEQEKPKAKKTIIEDISEGE